MYSNIISLGDHCAIPLLLKELDLRKKSYPFDWTTHEDQTENTNIMYNLMCIQRLFYDTIDHIVNDYIGFKFTGKQSFICFPHEHGSYEDIKQKYTRRFERLKQDLSQKNVYLMLTRHYSIDPSVIDWIIKNLLQNGSILVFISGIYHPYFDTMNYENVIFKYIPYDVKKFDDYDFIFRPMIKSYLADLFKNILHDRSS